jgi:hypothetical protein
LRFVVTGELHRNRLLQAIVLLYSAYVAGLWITNTLLYFEKMSLTYASVVDYYLGSEARFLPARSYQGLLEVSHFHLFAMGMLLMVLTHLMLFVPLANRTKLWLIVVPFLAAALDEAAGWLVRFAHPLFAYAKIAGFLLLQASLGALVVLSVWSVFRGSSGAYRGEPLDDDDDDDLEEPLG